MWKKDEFIWYERGYLRHYEAGGFYQSLTYRLADSIPQKVLKEIAGSTDCQSTSTLDKTTSSPYISASCIQESDSRGDRVDYQSALLALPAILQKGEPFCQREYWDRFIRDEKHFFAMVDYIHQNLVKVGLVNEPEQWVYLIYKKGLMR